MLHISTIRQLETTGMPMNLCMCICRDKSKPEGEPAPDSVNAKMAFKQCQHLLLRMVNKDWRYAVM